jgi:hypothetical protein
MRELQLLLGRRIAWMSSVAAELQPIAPISEPQRQALQTAEAAARRFAFAPKLATLNGGGMLLAAAISLVLGVFDHGLLLSAAVLGASGWFELDGGKRLRAYDPRAPIRLALNQLVLLALVVSYASFKLIAAFNGENSLTAELAEHPELAAMLEQVDDPNVAQALDSMGEMYRWGIVAVYSGLMGVAAIIQGGVAAYYLSRRKHLQAFLETTPAWVIDFLSSRADPAAASAARTASRKTQDPSHPA